MIDHVHIATVCHEANRAYRTAIGEDPGPAWGEATQAQRDSCVAGVRAISEDPELTPEASHQKWLDLKLAGGWTAGPLKDEKLRQHPCCVPYDKLPLEQRVKDRLFGSIVRALLQPKEVSHA